MLLTIDIGNTNIVFALYEGGTQKQVWRCQTESSRTSDEYISWLYPLFDQAGYKFDQIERAIISSVVPDANYHLKQLCRNAFKCEARLVTRDMIDLVVDMNKPEEVGADRLVNSLAVKIHYKTPAIIIDFGTATTFDVIDAQGHYVGGVIAPGVNLSVEALHQAAAKLPRVGVEKPVCVIGKDTVSAMQSGVYWGYIAMIEGMVERIRNEMEEKKCLVLATGGLASLFVQGTDVIDEVDSDLTLKGLVYIDQQQNPQKKAA
ncbi:MAG: type III pantothenate kinase [Alphaproteobacteria bacterium]|nr:type III pantothenate kinase [Alphaproteobacteria bacterium]